MNIKPNGLILLVSLFASLNVFGQSREANPFSTHQFPIADSANDTLGWWIFTQGTQTLYSSPNGGYVFGNNGFNDLAKARSFSKDDTSSVDEVLLLFGAMALNSGDTNSYMRVVAYRPDSLGYGVIGLRVGAPGTEIGSVDLLLSEIDTSGGFSYVDMSSITVDTTDFLIGVDLTTMSAGDTVGLISTTHGDAGEDETSWEKHSDSAWVTILHPNISWDLDCHPGIFCILNAMEVGLNESIPLSVQVWPNPSNGALNIANPSVSDLIVNILSIDSRVVFNESVPSREHISLDLSDLNSGTYVLQTLSAAGKTSQMIIIQ